jgi:hypothetical protein
VRLLASFGKCLFHRLNSRFVCSAGVAGAALLLLCFASSCSSSGFSHPAFSNSSLKGNYTYTLSGTAFSQGGSQPFEEAGTFIADGNGNITGGIDDFVENSTLSSNKTTGSYTVGTNGNATMTMQSSRGTIQFAMTLISSSDFYLIEYDSFASGSGEALQQTSGPFSATPAGTFVFRLHSTLPNSAVQGSVSNVGQIVIQGGGIRGTEDVLRNGVPGSLSMLGLMDAPDANGRGTATLNDSSGNQSSYVYYIVDSHTLKFLETDPGPLGNGRADAQIASSFSNTSLTGAFCFRGRGDTMVSSFGFNGLGAFVTDGNGNITSGTYDSVQDGNPLSNVPVTGSYTVSSNGRAAINLTPKGMNSIPLIVWLINSSSGLLLVDSPSLSVVGRMDQQQGIPFSAASLNGPYAFYMFGVEGSGAPPVNRVGVMSFDGSSTITFSDYFVNLGGTTARNGPVRGNYSVSSNGRVVAFSVGGVKTQVIYLISNTSGSLILDTDGSDLAGSLALQSAP